MLDALVTYYDISYNVEIITVSAFNFSSLLYPVNSCHFMFYRKISIHDTNPEVFRMFLEYVYGGVLDEEGLTTEHLTELLTLADRYEVRHTYVVSEVQTCVYTWLYSVAKTTTFAITFIAEDIIDLSYSTYRTFSNDTRLDDLVALTMTFVLK